MPETKQIFVEFKTSNKAAKAIEEVKQLLKELFLNPATNEEMREW